MTALRVNRNGLPEPPVEIADEVELWARQSGRHATLRFVPILGKRRGPITGTWVVCLTLRANDKRLGLLQQQKVAEEPTEKVWLHEPDGQGGYRAFDIVQLGASGVRNLLERGDMWSGRGEFDSLEHQLRVTKQWNEAARAKNRAEAKDGARSDARDKRRQWFGIPLVSVVGNLFPRRQRGK